MLCTDITRQKYTLASLEMVCVDGNGCHRYAACRPAAGDSDTEFLAQPVPYSVCAHAARVRVPPVNTKQFHTSTHYHTTIMPGIIDAVK
jgi:hypothetical protein